MRTRHASKRFAFDANAGEAIVDNICNGLRIDGIKQGTGAIETVKSMGWQNPMASCHHCAKEGRASGMLSRRLPGIGTVKVCRACAHG